MLISAERVARGKPDPEGYLLAAAELGKLPENCLVFEDAPAGVEAAHRARMDVIVLLTTHACEEFVSEFTVPDFQDLKIDSSGGGFSVRRLGPANQDRANG